MEPIAEWNRSVGNTHRSKLSHIPCRRVPLWPNFRYLGSWVHSHRDTICLDMWCIMGLFYGKKVHILLVASSVIVRGETA